jgi:uncharacterized surface protein with fasciclin (FAS1) repeats
MSRNVLVSRLSVAVVALLAALIFVSRQKGDTLGELRIDSDRRVLKAHHEEDGLHTFWGPSVRAKKEPLPYDTWKYETALTADHRESERSSKGSKGSSSGKGKSGRSDSSRKDKSGGSSDFSKKGKSGGSSYSSGKGKQKKSKSTHECSVGFGKGKQGKGSIQWNGEEWVTPTEIDCEDYDFVSVSSTNLGVSSSTDLEGCHRNVLEQAHSISELSTFVQLVGMAGLSCLFHCGGPFTLLAPTNSAFAALNPEAAEELLRPENLIYLQDLIMDHILPGFHLSANLNPGSIDTLVEKSLELNTDPLSFGSSMVVTPDIVGCNGVLFIVDAVIVPTSGTLSSS